MIGPSRKIYQEDDTDSEEESNFSASKASQRSGMVGQNSQSNNKEEKDFFDLGIPVDAFATLSGHKKAISCI